MDDWVAHTGGTAFDLPYEDVPGDPVPGTIDMATIADHLTTKGALIQEATLLGPIGLIVFEFERGRLDGPPVPIATGSLIGTPEQLRRFGWLARDTCNQLADRIERA